MVDEFATLAKEIPEFVEGVVDVAARGRSLGLRLVLATQRPAGVINDRIRANVGVRIALRVNDEADSIDVIGERRGGPCPADAARVGGTSKVAPGPGRVPERLRRRLCCSPAAARGSIEVRDLDAGLPRATSAPATGPTGHSLEAVVAAPSEGHAGEPLVGPARAVAAGDAEPAVTVASLAEQVSEVASGSVLLGLADLPSEQAQRVVVFDLAQHQSMLVFGTSRSGKTTLLRTLPPDSLSR